MAKKLKLTIELVPSTCWYTNVRSNVSPDRWDLIRRSVYRRARYLCEVCGGKGDQWPVECHEIWQYNDRLHVQTLTGFTALCPACHQVKHIGLAQINGKLDEAIKHFAKANGLKMNEAMDHIDQAFEKCTERSKYSWKLDIRILKRYGVT